MFKKTPVALAILSVAASMSVACADDITSITTPNWQPYESPREGLYFTEIRASDKAVGQPITIQTTDAIGFHHQGNNQIYLKGTTYAKDKGFTDPQKDAVTGLNIQSVNGNALQFDSGNLALGFTVVDHQGVTPEDISGFTPLKSLTLHSEKGSAIYGKVTPGLEGMSDHCGGELNILAKDITLISESADHATVSLNGQPREANLDFDGSQVEIRRYDETSWNRADEPSWIGKDQSGEDIYDEAGAKYYGVFTDDEIKAGKHQTLTVVGVNQALRLVNGGLFDVMAGTVDITGNTYIHNGSIVEMGFTTNGLTDLPDAWVSWESYPEGGGHYVVEEGPDQENYYELINSVTIRGTAIPTNDPDGQKAAIHVEAGSMFATAANHVSISGAVVEKDKDSPHQSRKPVNEFFKQVKNHFGSDFRLLQAWQDQVKQHGHDGSVVYGDAIYMTTDKSSQYELRFEDGTLKESAIPSIVSIWGEKTLEINGDIVLDFKDHFSGSLLYIGAHEDAKVLINGDIHVYNDKDGDHENTIKLDLHEGQLFIGSIIDHTVEEPQKQAKFMMRRSGPMLAAATEESKAGTHLTIRNNHSTILTDDSVITRVTTDNASIMTIDNAPVTIKQLNLEGDTNFYTFDVTKGQFKIEALSVGAPTTYGLRARDDELTPKLGFTVANIPADMSDKDVAGLVQFGDGSDGADAINPGYTVTMNESADGPERTVNVSSGSLADATISGKQEDNTSVSKAIRDVAGLSVLAWRAQMNDVNKRLGDLRTYKGQYGAWARAYGSESKFGDLGLKSESNTIQLGADMKLADDYYFGATASYTDGKGTLDNGATDDRSYSFGVYGGWMADNGQFVDVIVKAANFKNEFDLHYTTGERSHGELDLWGASVCAEYGWRLTLADGLWVEPQAEVTYGYMNDVTYTYSGDVKATQEATESLVGRLGVAFGTTFDQGSAYVKASVAHDWKGETEISMSNGNKPMTEDLGGTWGEFAIGGTYNFTNGWAVYGEFQTAKGSKMKTPYQWNIGARYVF